MIEWVFAVCMYVDPVMQPYRVRQIGPGVVAPTREACETGRTAVSEWSKASGEVYLVGGCQELSGFVEDLERQRNQLSCPVPPN